MTPCPALDRISTPQTLDMGQRSGLAQLKSYIAQKTHAMNPSSFVPNSNRETRSSPQVPASDSGATNS